MALKQYGADLVINGLAYALETRGDSPPHEREPLLIQEADSKVPFAREFKNGAHGWGWGKYTKEGTYDYVLDDGAMLHRKNAWINGATVTMMAPATQPDGPVAFGEYWDGLAITRRLICAADRWVYEINSIGSIGSYDLTGSIAAGGAMGKPERYKTGAIATRMYIPVQSPNVGDLFIVRTSAGNYSETTSTFRAEAMAVAIDSGGDYVLWIGDPAATDGQIRQCVALADPQNVGSFAGASYAIGEASLRVNDMMQQNKRMLVARPDGIYTFNNVAKSVPIISLVDVLDADNGKYLADYNGSGVAPTVAGLVLVDGLVWEPVGPVSSNKDARHLRNDREYAFAPAGDYCYAGTFDGTDTRIWLGTRRGSSEVASGEGPIVWHGPVATVKGRQIAPGGLKVWTGWGKKLFIGFTNRIGYIELEDDFSPTPNSLNSHIQFPEGALDIAGPAVVTEIHSVEYIGTNDIPLSVASNWWDVRVTVDGVLHAFGVSYDGVTYAKAEAVEEVAGRRIALELVFIGSGRGELESFIVSGITRPLNHWRHIVRIRADRVVRTNLRSRLHRSPEKLGEELRALFNAGWKGMVQFGEERVYVQVTDFKESTIASRTRSRPTKYYELTMDEVVT